MTLFLSILGSFIFGSGFRRLYGWRYSNWFMAGLYATIVSVFLILMTSRWEVIIPALIIAIGWRKGFYNWTLWWYMSTHYTRFTLAAAFSMLLLFDSWLALLYAPVGLIGLTVPLLHRLVPRDSNGVPKWDYKAVCELINGGVITSELVAIVLLVA